MFLWILIASAAPDPSLAFESYGGVPTWTGVASGWQTGAPEVHVYDTVKFPGHAEFVSRGLKTGLRFKEFKRRVQGEDREYVPFFLYDLRGASPTVDGRVRTWAVRLEDYQYLDDDASLGRTAARLAHRVAAELELEPAGGIVILARSSGVRPNRASAPQVEAAGFAHATLSVVTRAAPPVIVLNPGTAVGRLRRADPAAPFAYGPEDIVVFEALPERVPPVAAVITLAPQTPLSHVNLLARNRGTPNAFVRSFDAIGAAEGQWIRLEAAKGLSVKALSEVEARAALAARAPKRVELPVLDRSVGLVDLRSRPTVSQVGAKAANYGMLMELLPGVRPGYALGFAAYFDHLERGEAPDGIRSFLQRRRSLDADRTAAELKAIRRAIRDTPVDPGLVAQLRALLDTGFGGPRIRLRSSTNNEDLPTFNGAGLYTSKGFDRVDDDAKLARKLTKVFASLWSDAAYAEREFYGIDHTEVGMAVLLHEAFVDELANGVALTLPDGTLVVNANPREHAVANPREGTLPEHLELPLGQPAARRVVGRSTVGPVFDGPYASLLPELDRQVGIVHRHMLERRRQAGDTRAYGVDVELKIVAGPDGPRVVIKQARLLAGP